MTVAIEVVDDPARACAAVMLGAALGGGEIVLTGGSTPKQAYGEFVKAVREAGVDLGRTRFWIGDERCVPPEDSRSNYGMIEEALIDPLTGETTVEVRRILGELGPEAAADAYERELREAGPPQFDLVLLGIGPDGHTASLFPGQSTLEVRGRLTVAVPEAGLEPFVPRVSLTLSALTAGRRIIVLATGESKAEAVGRAFGSAAQPDRQVPASLLAPDARQITVLLDRAAASRLDP